MSLGSPASPVCRRGTRIPLTVALRSFYIKTRHRHCSLTLYPNAPLLPSPPHPRHDSSPPSPACVQSGRSIFCNRAANTTTATASTCLNYRRMSRMPISFLWETNPFLLLCKPPTHHHLHHFSKPTHKHTSYAASLKCIPLFLKWGGECCRTQNGHWHIS